MVRKLKIYFQALDGCVGHLNACLGLAQALAGRGHEVAFMVAPAQKGRVAKAGFPEILLETQRGDPSSDHDRGHSHNHDHGPSHEHSHDQGHGHNHPGPKSGAKSFLEQLKSQSSHSHDNQVHSQVVINGQIGAILARHPPELIVLDNFLISPSIQSSGIPWIYLFSANPLGMYVSEKLPPFGAGFATSLDPSAWAQHKALQLSLAEKVFASFQDQINKACHFTPTPSLNPYDPSKSVFPMSPYLNIYGYPKELDYDDIAPLPEKTIRVDAFARAETSLKSFSLPEKFQERSGEKLIFFSLGSQASADVTLMKRILGVLEKTPYWYIVSKGPKASEYELPPNCWGEGYLPQPLILPLVDLVITHGGNNTLTETFAEGKPMIVLPVSADHLDNGQRIAEKGYGIQLDTYGFKDKELLDAIEKGLHDETLHRKVAAAHKRIVEEKSKEVACKAIEELAEKVAN